jgi:hypothetical protein
MHSPHDRFYAHAVILRGIHLPHRALALFASVAGMAVTRLGPSEPGHGPENPVGAIGFEPMTFRL